MGTDYPFLKGKQRAAAKAAAEHAYYTIQRWSEEARRKVHRKLAARYGRLSIKLRRKLRKKAKHVGRL